MKIEEKKAIVESLVEMIKESNHFYVTDISNLNAAKTSELRKKCYEKDITIKVVKNTLLIKALDQIEGEFSELTPTLKGNTAVMFCAVGNVPAKLIKELRKGNDKPILKAAYVEESVYVGDNQLDALTMLKSKDELVGDIIGLLQSPMQKLIGALQSGQNTIAGLVKTLEERAEA